LGLREVFRAELERAKFHFKSGEKDRLIRFVKSNKRKR
jgi:hypothetical protein